MASGGAGGLKTAAEIRAARRAAENLPLTAAEEAPLIRIQAAILKDGSVTVDAGSLSKRQRTKLLSLGFCIKEKCDASGDWPSYDLLIWLPEASPVACVSASPWD